MTDFNNGRRFDMPKHPNHEDYQKYKKLFGNILNSLYENSDLYEFTYYAGDPYFEISVLTQSGIIFNIEIRLNNIQLCELTESGELIIHFRDGTKVKQKWPKKMTDSFVGWAKWISPFDF